MNFLELMKHRYTTKKYQAGAALPPNKIADLAEILRLSPSSINSQPWFFTIIGDKDLKDTLAQHARHNNHKVQDCSHLFVLSVYQEVADFERERLPLLPEGAQQYYRNNLQPLGEEAIRSWMRQQVYIALGILLSACAVMAIDATPMEGIDTLAFTRILNHAPYEALVAVAVGQRAGDDTNQPAITPKDRRTLTDVITTLA